MFFSEYEFGAYIVYGVTPFLKSSSINNSASFRHVRQLDSSYTNIISPLEKISLQSFLQAEIKSIKSNT